MRLLILGKSGQVGWELQRALSPLGDVVALGRAEADLEDAEGLRTAIDAAKPDVIVNASAYTAVDKAETESDRADRVNNRAVSELAERAARRGAWLIHYSTDYVFDGQKAGPYIETDETNPQSAYGRSKRDGERAITVSEAKHFIFRTSWVHAGRGDNFIRTMLRLAGEREQLRVVADQRGAPTSAELIADVTAHAVAAIARDQSPPIGIYHLTASGETTWNGLARFVIAEATALGVPLMATADAVTAIETAEYPTLARRPRNSLMSGDKLEGAFGLTLPEWELHARRTIVALSHWRTG